MPSILKKRPPTAAGQQPTVITPRQPISSSDQVTALRRANPAGIDVNSYAGSAFSAPDSYTAARPSTSIGLRRAAPAPVVPPPTPAIRTQFKSALPVNQPAAIQPALNTPGNPVASPTTSAAPQTEGANPLTGDGNAQPPGTTDDVNPAKKLGFSQRGADTPAGTDADGDAGATPNSGGSGLYKRTFSSPKAAGIYDQYVKKIFGNAQP